MRVSKEEKKILQEMREKKKQEREAKKKEKEMEEKKEEVVEPEPEEVIEEEVEEIEGETEETPTDKDSGDVLKLFVQALKEEIKNEIISELAQDEQE